MLDPNFIKLAAARGNFHFELIPSGEVPSFDAWAFSGDGVDDLDRLLLLMSREPKTRVSIDQGDINASFVGVTRADVVALRSEYIKQHGKVNKINEFLPLDNGSAVFLPITRRQCS